MRFESDEDEEGFDNSAVSFVNVCGVRLFVHKNLSFTG